MKVPRLLFFSFVVGLLALALTVVAQEPRLVMAGLDVSDPDDRDVLPPLREAAWDLDLEAARLLLAQGVNVNETDAQGYTALHAVVEFTATMEQQRVGRTSEGVLSSRVVFVDPHQQRRLQLVQLLVSKGADVNARSTDGRTPLHVAAASGSFSIVKFLVGRGANPAALAGQYGIEPLGYASLFSPGWSDTRTQLIDFLTIALGQKILQHLGYDPGPIDGVRGKRMVQALRQLQHDHNLPVNGFLDRTTLGTLRKLASETR